MASEFEDGAEAEQTISIGEYLKDVEDQELEVDLVLGGDEGKECTYSKGYLKRQAIFSCLTCTPNGNAGVCTACSLACHDGHEIVELWTKRSFRCDCGNSKFNEFFCKLCANKDVENLENSYNHNFKGSYCTCGRPYPDPDVEDQVEMIQCCVCEDWFHEEHIGLNSANEIPRDEEGEPLYEDFICQACAAVCSFLALYPLTILAAATKQGDSATSDGKNKNILLEAPLASVTENVENENAPCKLESSTSTDNSKSISEEKVLANGESSSNNTHASNYGKDPVPNAACVLESFGASEPLVGESRPLFLSKNWRDVLCRCIKCLDMYSCKKVSFLVDKEDSIMEYEKMAKQKREEKMQQQDGEELKLLNKLGHVEKMEILNGIADMKDEIRSFLESFDPSKAVTSADIHQVFENLAKKRRRT